MSRRRAPYGGWRSPIRAELLAAAAVGLSALQAVGEAIYWVEARPLEKGRSVLVRWTTGGRQEMLTPAGFNLRSTVHEYGGGAYRVHGQTVYFVNYADQRIYRQAPGGAPQPITPAPEAPGGLRYADLRLTAGGERLYCVRQRQVAVGFANELVLLLTDGSAAPRSIAGGRDFYSDPRLSSDGRRLAYLCWDHPNMPWDGAELWLAEVTADGGLANARRLAGGPDEAVYQPCWGPGGELYYVADRTGWWNLYRWTENGDQPLLPLAAEFGQPQWQFGFCDYVCLPDGRLACRYSQGGFDHLGLLDLASGELQPLEIGCTQIGYLAEGGGRLWLVGGSPVQAPAILAVDLASRGVEVVRSGLSLALDPADLARPQPLTFPTAGGEAYALYYPPTNPNASAPPGEKPPLLVISHGGPTDAARSSLSLKIQYWTSRGFGVVEVNYGGSSGYGRAYRQRLNGQWGVVDVQDCLAAARYLAAQGAADGRWLAVRGSSAGGYTALCCLAFHDLFAAGASYYGIADLELLAKEMHKFEAHYLDRLVGPYPAARELYRQRSPLHHAGQIACPLIVFQGLEDRVVPPSQAERLLNALEAQGKPYAYLAFAGEQHGFRQAETIMRAAEAELYFYSRVFGFTLPEPIPLIEIHYAKD